MEDLKHASNVELLSALAGRKAAEALVGRYAALTDLAQASFDELQSVTGVGRSKAAAIKSAFLLAQRMSQETFPNDVLMDTPDRVADLLREENRLHTVEHLQAILVNTRRHLIGVRHICQGTLDCVLTTAREVFAPAIARKAAALILAHNHPSGDPAPSEADIRMTRDLIRAGQLLKIELLDHVILGRSTPNRPKDFFSMREGGYFL